MKANTQNKDHKKNRKQKRTKNKTIKILLTVLIVLFLPLAAIYVYVTDYYQKHFYSDTEINGINTSNMTLSEAENVINAKVEAYRLSLEERNNGKDFISSKEIGLHTEFEKSISDLLKEQQAYQWPVLLFKQHSLQVNTMLQFDEELLMKSFHNLNCFKEENDIDPVNASISGYGENGYEIIPEQPGAKVLKEKLYEAVKIAVNSLEPSLSVEDAGCYLEPEITSEYPELVDAVKEMNKLAGAEITYQFGKDTEVLDGSKISQWITVDDQFQVSFDPSGIKDFVDYIGKTYNSFGRVRTFKTSYGKVIKVKGGDYGWWLNRTEETQELTELVENGEKVNREPVYYQTAQQYGKDDIGGTYVEVNLTAQHLFLYKNGKLILQSDFVSGNVSKNLGTPTGTYPIQYKENDATLVGEDYSTPVKYWMPFNKNIGLHDASWRSEFGKDIYLTKGSHGCINMPPAAAKKMFKNIQRGVAVVVYELPGTENYGTDQEKAPEKTAK